MIASNPVLYAIYMVLSAAFVMCYQLGGPLQHETGIVRSGDGGDPTHVQMKVESEMEKKTTELY